MERVGDVAAEQHAWKVRRAPAPPTPPPAAPCATAPAAGHRRVRALTAAQSELTAMVVSRNDKPVVPDMEALERFLEHAEDAAKQSDMLLVLVVLINVRAPCGAAGAWRALTDAAPPQSVEADARMGPRVRECVPAPVRRPSSSLTARSKSWSRLGEWLKAAVETLTEP